MSSYNELLADLPNRQAQVLKACIMMSSKNLKITDRTLKDFIGFDDMNQVRPRVTELLKSQRILEVDSIQCPLTNRSVRVLNPKL